MFKLVGAPSDNMKTLNQLRLGERAVIASLSLEAPSTNLLSALGLLPGRVIEIARFAPLGDPIGICVEGQHISLRLADAADIQVEDISAR